MRSESVYLNCKLWTLNITNSTLAPENPLITFIIDRNTTTERCSIEIPLCEDFPMLTSKVTCIVFIILGIIMLLLLILLCIMMMFSRDLGGVKRRKLKRKKS